MDACVLFLCFYCICANIGVCIRIHSHIKACTFAYLVSRARRVSLFLPSLTWRARGERDAHTDRDQTCPIRGMASRLSRWWCRHHTFICRDNAIYEDKYCYIYGLILLYMCPHTAICMCPHTDIYVFFRRTLRVAAGVAPHQGVCYIPVLILLYMCPHTAVCVSVSVCSRALALQ